MTKQKWHSQQKGKKNGEIGDWRWNVRIAGGLGKCGERPTLTFSTEYISLCRQLLEYSNLLFAHSGIPH